VDDPTPLEEYRQPTRDGSIWILLDPMDRWHIDTGVTCALSEDGLLCVEQAAAELAEALQFAVGDAEHGKERS
jgi:hypothetical protein